MPFFNAKTAASSFACIPPVATPVSISKDASTPTWVAIEKKGDSQQKSNGKGGDTKPDAGLSDAESGDAGAPVVEGGVDFAGVAHGKQAAVQAVGQIHLQILERVQQIKAIHL